MDITCTSLPSETEGKQESGQKGQLLKKVILQKLCFAYSGSRLVASLSTQRGGKSYSHALLIPSILLAGVINSSVWTYFPHQAELFCTLYLLMIYIYMFTFDVMKGFMIKLYIVFQF